jgi:hypothetical protein
MQREIPGAFDNPNRDFVYIEATVEEDFLELVHAIRAENPEVPQPQFGGIMETLATVSLEHGRMLLGMTYKGDILGWRNKIAAYCQGTNREWGIASNGVLVMNDGRRIVLSERNVAFHP